MLPVLQIGPLALPVYPMALVLALWVGLAAGAWAARRQRIAADHIYNAGLYGIAIAIVVARLAHVASFWPAYRAQPLEIVGLNTRALLWWPGFVAGLLAAGLYAHRHRLPWARVADAAALGALVGLGVVWMGSLLAGRGLGAPTGLPWGVLTWDVPRHPFQLYWMLAAFAAAGGVAWLLVRQKPPGIAALVALAGCGLAALLIEPARADSLTTAGGMRVAQLLGLAAVILALLCLRARRPPQDAPPHL